jgi:K+-sensing histidine kinase KdpD
METIRDKKQLDYLQNAEQAMHAIKNQSLFTRDYKDMGMEKADWQDIEATINRAVANNHGKYLHFDFRVKGLEIFADPWLMKVFFNLTDNMIRFGLSTNTIYVSSKESEDGLDVYFEGEGKGIPADQKEIIFQHGYGDTNGFGLFLAREILAITGITVKETGDTEKKVRFELRIPRRAYRFRAIEIPDKK